MKNTGFNDSFHFAEAALAAARAGLVVFPLVPRGTTPLTAKVVKQASMDPGQAAVLWTMYPDANIGCLPGKSGLVVIAVDGFRGRGSADRLGLLSQPTRTSVTGLPDGSEALWYWHPGGTIGNVDLGPGLDVLADTGYVVLPPSVHESGRTYKWFDPRPVTDLPPAVAAKLRRR